MRRRRQHKLLFAACRRTLSRDEQFRFEDIAECQELARQRHRRHGRRRAISLLKMQALMPRSANALSIH